MWMCKKTVDHEFFKWNGTDGVGLSQGYSPFDPRLYFVFPCTQLSYSSGNLQRFYTTHRKWDLLWGGEVSNQRNDHTYSLRTGDTDIFLFICICISTDRKWRQTRIVLVVAISRKKSPSTYVLKAKLGIKERPSFVCIFCIKCKKYKFCGYVMFVSSNVTCLWLISRFRKEKYIMTVVRWNLFWPVWLNTITVLHKSKKVKITLLQASWPWRGYRGIALPILNLDTRRGWVVSTTPRPLYPWERPGTHCTGGWVGPRTGLDMCEKSLPHRDFFSIPGSSSP
jgi:hypothetical protein